MNGHGGEDKKATQKTASMPEQKQAPATKAGKLKRCREILQKS